MFEYERTDDRLTMTRRGTRWLSNGVNGGYVTAASAHNLTVPEGFDRTDLERYAAERLGEEPTGPTLLTGVHQTHARGARAGPIEAVVTAGVSNPAVLSMSEPGEAGWDAGPSERADLSERTDPDERADPGTVNVFVGTERALSDAGLAGLLSTVVEAKTATLLDRVGCTGTTSDAIAIGCAPDGEPTPFAGSATTIGNAARVCVRDAVTASLESRYGGSPPDPGAATHGIETTGSATVFDP